MLNLDDELTFCDKKRKGYDMLKDAIEMLAQKGSKAPLYKEVFPQIGEKYNMSAALEERDIRYLLKKAKCDMSSKKYIKSVANKILK